MPGALLVPPAFRLWTTKAEPPHLSQSQAGAVQPVQAAVSVTDLAVEGAGFLATIDADGYATIIGREKDLITNAAGKNMSPANIEGAVAADSPLIAQVVAVSDRRPGNAALIALDPDRAAAFAARHSTTTPARRAGRPPRHPRRDERGSRAGQRPAVSGRYADLIDSLYAAAGQPA